MAQSFPEPEIGEHPERKIVALAGDFTMETRHEIPALWNRFFSQPFEVDTHVPGAMFGVSYGMDVKGAFSYGVGIEAENPTKLPDGACVIASSKGTYAVFRNTSPVAELPGFIDHIYCEWMPKSGYTPRDGAMFERYPDSPDNTAENMTYEIWAPIQPK